MTTHVHKLEGCAPTPLAHYLKALAILRLVSEQVDSNARGWWKDEAFWLATTLSREELLRFFLEDYRPTPLLSPWNGGSGFFYKNDVGLGPIERSVASRLEPFRAGIVAARAISTTLASAIVAHKIAEDACKANNKDDNAKPAAAEAKRLRDAAKAELLPACRRLWSDGLLQWFDAALVVGGDGSASWPALLGSGGNDGRLDFTNNSMQHISTLIDCASQSGAPTSLARTLLPSALFASTTPGLSSFAAGQFSPGSAGGDNMGAGFEGKSLVNPWDFLLMLEGCVVLSSSVARRTDSDDLPQAAAPFAVRSAAAGYLSAASADEGPRGEQWMPMWSQPSKLSEVAQLFGEGRVRIGRETATRATDIPRALARLGAARGVTTFVRYGFIERNGQANLAVPIGRWQVSAQPNERLLDDIAGWVGKVRAVARDERAPQALSSTARLLDEAVLAVCRGSDSLRWQQLLIALGRAEAALLISPKVVADPMKKLTPIPPLNHGWLYAANDGTPEFRLALALASQDAVFRTKDGEMARNVRGHWMPIDRSYPPRRQAKFATGAAGLTHDPDVVCVGGSLEQDCLALVTRRIHMASTLNARGLGLFGTWGCHASLADIMAFLDGTVDTTRILALARALMALKWWDGPPLTLQRPVPISPDATFSVLRIAHLAWPLLREGGEVRIQLDAGTVTRLAAGDVAGAVAICLRRLRASGLSPTIRIVANDPARARRLAASLAFPISQVDASRCADLVTKPYLTDSTAT